MAFFTTDSTIGNAGVPTQFVTSTRIWSSGNTTFSNDVAAADLEPSTGVTLTARDCVIHTSGLKTYSGTNPNTNANLTTDNALDFENVVIDGFNWQHGNSWTTLTFNNVTIHHNSTRTTSATIGNWGANGTSENLAPYIWNNVRLWAEPLSGNLSSLTYFITLGSNTDVSDTSLSNVSFWNGELASVDILGMALTSGTGLVWDSPVFGPLGFDASGFGGGYSGTTLDLRMPIRISTPGNDPTVWGSLDIRGLQGNTSHWCIAADATNTNVFVNPLWGFPGSGLGWSGIATEETTLTTANILVGTHPVSSAADFKLVNDDTSLPMFMIPENVTAANLPVEVTSDIITHASGTGDADFGIGIQHELLSTAALSSASEAARNTAITGILNRLTGGANWTDETTVATGFTALTEKSYRHYSWQRDEWGQVYNIAVPAAGATDEQLATARAGGFNHFNGAAFTETTSIDVNSVLDPITAGFASPSDATAQNVVGGVTTAVGAVALSKATDFNAITTTHSDLPYTISGTTVTYDRDVVFSLTASAYADTGSTITFPSGSVNASDVVTDFVTSADLTLPVGAVGTDPMSYTAANVNLMSTSPRASVTATLGFANFPTTIEDGSIFNGTFTSDSAVTLTVENPDDVADLTLAGDGPWTVNGASRSSFAGAPANTIFPFNVTISIDTSSLAQTAFYRILVDGATVTSSLTFGQIGSNNTLLNLSSVAIDIEEDTVLTISVTGADAAESVNEFTLNGVNETFNIFVAANPNFNAGGTASNGVTGARSGTGDTALFTWTVDGGLTLGGGDTNATFGSTKSSQDYADFIAYRGTANSLDYPSTVAVQFKSASHRLVTVGTTGGGANSDATIQGLRIDTGAISAILTQGTFTGTGSINIGLAADTAIDYGSIGAEVQSRTDALSAELTAEGIDIRAAITTGTTTISGQIDEAERTILLNTDLATGA